MTEGDLKKVYCLFNFPKKKVKNVIYVVWIRVDFVFRT